jgi:hypothetical protein
MAPLFERRRKLALPRVCSRLFRQSIFEHLYCSFLRFHTVVCTLKVLSPVLFGCRFFGT